ncbi:hypothetical protein V5O48_018588 [Marasmius crinis-equi]|uniref:Uncharacterized protein n=1 Tax=Marasmius crinis-equi TaxID=585013 RepID=A0ABR3EKS0_9AGAR
MGIASTLIIVRSALGIAIQDEKSFKASVLRELPGDGSTPDWIDSVIDIRRRSTTTNFIGTIRDEERNLGVGSVNKEGKEV